MLLGAHSMATLLGLSQGEALVDMHQELVVARPIRRDAILHKVNCKVALQVAALHHGEAQRPQHAAVAAAVEEGTSQIPEASARSGRVDGKVADALQISSLGTVRYGWSKEVLH
jgi:hypothetical protein